MEDCFGEVRLNPFSYACYTQKHLILVQGIGEIKKRDHVEHVALDSS